MSRYIHFVNEHNPQQLNPNDAITKIFKAVDKVDDKVKQELRYLKKYKKLMRQILNTQDIIIAKEKVTPALNELSKLSIDGNNVVEFIKKIDEHINKLKTLLNNPTKKDRAEEKASFMLRRNFRRKVLNYLMLASIVLLLLYPVVPALSCPWIFAIIVALIPLVLPLLCSTLLLLKEYHRKIMQKDSLKYINLLVDNLNQLKKDECTIPTNDAIKNAESPNNTGCLTNKYT